jgi:hypothetical protein
LKFFSEVFFRLDDLVAARAASDYTGENESQISDFRFQISDPLIILDQTLREATWDL